MVWQDTIKAVFLERVNIVANYVARCTAPAWKKLPSVVSAQTYVKPAAARVHALQRIPARPVLLPFAAGATISLSTIGSALGAAVRTTWINVVAACSPCNLRKGSLTMVEAKMWPSQMPFQPSVHQLHKNGRLFPPNYLHDSWLDYLYWDTELDP